MSACIVVYWREKESNISLATRELGTKGYADRIELEASIRRTNVLLQLLRGTRMKTEEGKIFYDEETEDIRDGHLHEMKFKGMRSQQLSEL